MDAIRWSQFVAIVNAQNDMVQAGTVTLLEAIAVTRTHAAQTFNNAFGSER